MYKVGQRVLVTGSDDWGKWGESDKGLTGIIVEINPKKYKDSVYICVYIPESINPSGPIKESGSKEYTWVLRDKDIQPLGQMMFKFMYKN